MSVNAAVKFNMKPGVRTSMNKATTVPTFKSSSANVASASSTTTTSSTNRVAYQATQALARTNGRVNAFQNMKYSSSPYSAGFKNPTPGDIKYSNVGLNLGVSVANGFALTPRGEHRVMTKYQDMLARMNYGNNYCNNSVADKMSTIAMLNELGKVAGTLTSQIKSAVSSSDSSAASTSNSASSAVKSAAETVTQELKDAKTTSEIQAALAKVNEQQAKIQGEISGLQETVNTELKNQQTAKENIEIVTGQIESENRNIQQQSGTITKLQSSLMFKKSELNMIQNQSKKANNIMKPVYEKQLAKIEAEIAQMEKDIKAAEDSKAKSEANVKTFTDAKGKYETALETAKKNWGEAQVQVEKKQAELEKLNKAEEKYTKKLDKKEDKEENKMASAYSELANIAKSYQSETDATKKSELQKEYKKLASEYNEMVKNSSSTKYTAVSAELS